MQTKLLAGILLVAYVLMRFIFPNLLDPFGYYASYAFEILFCLNAVFIFRPRLKIKFALDRQFMLNFVGSLVAGFLVFKLTLPLHLTIPFDLKNPEFIFLLVIFGPILEEFIFRFAFWHAFSVLSSPQYALALTTAVFSYAHFQAYFFVPADFHGFVFYQTAYTLIMGWWLGKNYLTTGAVGSPILLHIACNLGFLLGYLY